VGMNKATRWLLSVLRDNRGISLIELLTVILLFSVLLGGITTVVMMGQNIAQDTVMYSIQEDQFTSIASILVNEGLNSSRVTQTGDRYVFDNNSKGVIVEYFATEQALTIFHDETEMMTVEKILHFQINSDPVRPKVYEILIEGLNPYGESVTLTNRWTSRK
jgi:competence protein ComGC